MDLRTVIEVEEAITRAAEEWVGGERLEKVLV